MDQERADAHRRERRLPCLEPILVVDGPHRELADGTESERLEMAKRVARVRDSREGVTVLNEVRLHGVIGAAARLGGDLDGDAVVTETAQDLAHRLHRLRVRGNGDLEPADLRRASSHPWRL